MPFNVDGNTVRSYGLYRYMEGLVNEKSMAISSSDIPVLFVPGSGGSAKQVRSVASIMMNKTEMTSAPFRMHFYALDFNEELSFLSGAVVDRQRDFVIKAIATLTKMYSRKIILIGHSFGGTVIHALPAVTDFDISNLGLIITLAAPLTASPIVMDEAMVAFYEAMEKAWLIRRDDLRKVGVVSYSGGSKDYQVPDHLAAFPGSHVIHRPAWSIRGVDTSADHLCILWCNQLTRHSTRILYKYGLEEMKAHPRSARTIIKEFFQEERNNHLQNITDNGSALKGDEGSVSNSSISFVKIGTFDYPWVSRVYRGVLESSKKVFELEFHSSYAVYDVSLDSPCDTSLLFIYPNSLARSATLKNGSKVMTVNLLYNLNSTSGNIVMEGKSGCEFDITIKPNVFHAWYLLLVSNPGLLMHFTFSVLLALAIVEKLAGLEQADHYRGSGIYVNAAILITIFMCFTYNIWILESVFAATIFYAISCLYCVSVFVRYVKELVYSLIPKIMYFSSLLLNLLIFMLLPFNVYLANSALALLMVWKRTSRPFTILLGVAVGSVSAALGMAGPDITDVFRREGISNRVDDMTMIFRSLMDDDSDFDDEQLESPLSSQGGMNSGDGVVDDHKRHARAQHNALERRRRDNIKDMYTSLKDAVPDMQNERASRAVILRRAIEVIEEKQQQQAELQADCDRLRNETAELEREIRMLKGNLPKLHETQKTLPNLISPISAQPTSVSTVMKAQQGELRSEIGGKEARMG
nr:PGAP1 and Basic helix-loop-helix dimerisation region bHLH domain containing protein [Haemonchus contortus]